MQDANRDTGWTWKRIEKWHNFETRRTSRSRVAEREQAKAQFCTERQESSRARQLWRKSTSLFMSIIGDISTFKSESPFCSPSFPNLFQVQLDKKTWRKSSWIFSLLQMVRVLTFLQRRQPWWLVHCRAHLRLQRPRQLGRRGRRMRINSSMI